MAKSARKRKVPAQPPAAAPATITIEEAAKRLKVGRNQAYQAAHNGELPVIKIGKRLAALSRLLGETS
jgi:excisionase family DNA binding protein